MNTLGYILIILALPIGGAVGYFLRKSWAGREAASAEGKAQTLLEHAKNKERELVLQAKDQALKIVEEAKRDEGTRRQELTRLQDRLEKRESTFDSKILEIEKRQKDMTEKSAQLDQAKLDIVKIREEQIAKLERIAELSKDDAKRVLMENTELRMKDELLSRIRKLQATGDEEVEREAKSVLATAMQRLASNFSSETTTTVVDIPNEEMKGRIIGKEGRNIKALEALTGVELVIDDTPDSIVVSGFNAVRRHLAKRVLEKLMSDGRIHPGRIEETVEQVKKEMATDMKKAGDEAVHEVGVAGLDPRIVQLLGRLKYRTSYGQNQLRHSVEVSLLSGLIAEELGANVAVAKKGGLLHDIGKAIDHDVQGTHTELGYEIMKKYGLPEEVAYIAIAHHEETPKSLEGAIVKMADAISGARPGARKGTYENYIQRLDELEKVAKSFPGVDKSYAIQAGREIRVFVRPEKMDDFASTELARDIARKIEAELQYPGEIKVTVIREKRIIEYAR